MNQADSPAPSADDFDVRSVLDNVSLVIASARTDNYTAATAPDHLETIVRTDEGRNVARNRGIEEATNDWIVVADDDITFPPRLTAVLVDGMHEFHLVGLEDWWPMEWTLTRYTIFHRTLWERVGGFDESREHGADTDFGVRAEKVGGRICRLPRYTVPHHDDESSFAGGDHAEWVWYLLRRHPIRMAPKALLLGLRKIGVIDPSDVDYSQEWNGPSWGWPADRPEDGDGRPSGDNEAQP